MKCTHNHARTLVCLLILGSIFAGLFPSGVLAGQTQISFNSEAAIDGEIAIWGRPYPPQQNTEVSTDYEWVSLGQWAEKDTTQPGNIYCIERSYVSFDTSSIPDDASITSMKLKLKTESDFSLTDFTMEVRGGQQPVYGSSLEAGDWGCGTTTVSTWNTANYPGNNIYIELSIPIAQVNVAGRTQFELKSNREGTTPTGNEYISFYSGNSVGNEPKLEVTYNYRDWTFMIYLDADNDLESNGIGDFLEMAAVGSTNDVAIAVQMDRAVAYNASYGNWTDCRRFYITQGLTPAASPIQNLGEVNMGDPSVLINFVQWAVSQYPANNYMLILWDHGSGCLGGVCQDLSHNRDVLNMTELKQAMTSIRGFLGRNVNIVGFDACLMQMTEVAYQIRDTTDIVVGSEETIPLDGWPYDDILSGVTANPSVTPATLASNIVTLYVNSYQGGSQGTINDITLSSFYESNIVTNLAPAVSSLADRLTENLAGYRSQILTAIANTEFYYIANYHDLYDFSNEIRQQVPVSNVQTAAQNVMDALVAARIAEGHGPSHPQSHGLSIYLTDNPDSSYVNLDFSSATHWDEFLQNLHTKAPAVFSLTISLYDSKSGTTQPAPGVHMYYGSDTVTITAYPGKKYYFSSWKLDGTYYYSNPISVYMNYKDHTLICYMYR